MKQIVIRADKPDGFVVELFETNAPERIVQRAFVHEAGLARKFAARWSTIHGGCRVDDRTK